MINSKLSKKSLKSRSLKLKNKRTKKSKVSRKNVKNMKGGNLEFIKPFMRNYFSERIRINEIELDYKSFMSAMSIYYMRPPPPYQAANEGPEPEKLERIQNEINKLLKEDNPEYLVAQSYYNTLGARARERARATQRPRRSILEGSRSIGPPKEPPERRSQM